MIPNLVLVSLIILIIILLIGLFIYYIKDLCPDSQTCIYLISTAFITIIFSLLLMGFYLLNKATCDIAGSYCHFFFKYIIYLISPFWVFTYFYINYYLLTLETNVLFIPISTLLMTIFNGGLMIGTLYYQYEKDNKSFYIKFFITFATFLFLLMLFFLIFYELTRNPANAGIKIAVGIGNIFIILLGLAGIFSAFKFLVPSTAPVGFLSLIWYAITFLPCRIIELFEIIKKLFKITTKTEWIILLCEIIFVFLIWGLKAPLPAILVIFIFGILGFQLFIYTPIIGGIVGSALAILFTYLIGGFNKSVPSLLTLFYKLIATLDNQSTQFNKFLKPVYLSKETNLGIFQDPTINGNLELPASQTSSTIEFLYKHFKLTYFYPSDNVETDNKTFRYKFGLSTWIWINPQPKATSTEYSKYSNLINFGEIIKIQFFENKIFIKAQIACDKCGINNEDYTEKTIYIQKEILYQRWNNYIINYEGGTLDIFFNGVLISSSSNIVPYILTNKSVIAGAENGIEGAIKKTHYYNKILSKKEIDLINLEGS